MYIYDAQGTFTQQRTGSGSMLVTLTKSRCFTVDRSISLLGKDKIIIGVFATSQLD